MKRLLLFVVLIISLVSSFEIVKQPLRSRILTKAQDDLEKIDFYMPKFNKFYRGSGLKGKRKFSTNTIFLMQRKDKENLRKYKLIFFIIRNMKIRSLIGKRKIKYYTSNLYIQAFHFHSNTSFFFLHHFSFSAKISNSLFIL